MNRKEWNKLAKTFEKNVCDIAGETRIAAAPTIRTIKNELLILTSRRIFGRHWSGGRKGKAEFRRFL